MTTTPYNWSQQWLKTRYALGIAGWADRRERPWFTGHEGGVVVARENLIIEKSGGHYTFRPLRIKAF